MPVNRQVILAEKPQGKLTPASFRLAGGPVPSNRDQAAEGAGFRGHGLLRGQGPAPDELRSWVEAGRIKVQEDVIDGLENLPAALIGLLAGENRGKPMVRV